MFENITVGSDPEFFIYKDETPISSIGIIKGTKYKPEEVEPGYGVLKDNVLIEGNIPPASSKEEFIANFKNLKRIMSDILAIGGYRLVSADSAEFNKNQLRNKEARLFGCAPFINAWTLTMKSPANLGEMQVRVAGFHWHYGYKYSGDLSSDYIALYLTRAFDYFVVYPSRQIYNDPIRSKYYGDYGNFRLTSYGFEARSLGGYFTDDKYLDWLYDQGMKIFDYCSNPDNIKLLDRVTSPEENALENYKILNINLEEQLYGNINNIPVNNLVTETLE